MSSVWLKNRFVQCIFWFCIWTYKVYIYNLSKLWKVTLCCCNNFVPHHNILQHRFSNTIMPCKKCSTPLWCHYSKDLKKCVTYQAFTLNKSLTTIAIDLNMPLWVVQHIKCTWFIKRSRITLEPTVKWGEEQNGNLQAGAWGVGGLGCSARSSATAMTMTMFTPSATCHGLG